MLQAYVEFINSSTNVSENTTFTWDFGDGSPPGAGSHALARPSRIPYLQGTVGCETVVTLEAENYCNALQGGEPGHVQPDPRLGPRRCEHHALGHPPLLAGQ